MDSTATKPRPHLLRLRSALVLAVGGHVLLVAFVPRAVRVAPPSIAPIEIVVETTIEPPSVPAISTLEPPGASSRTPVPRVAGAVATVAGPVAALARGETIVEGAPAPLAIADVWSSGKAPSIDLPPGFVAAPSVATSPPPPPDAPSHRSAEAALRAALDAEDRVKGLGRAGPLVSAAHEATRASRIAVTSTGMLTTVVDAEGKVVAVTASVDDAAWRDLALALKRAMESKRLRVPSGARGLKIALRVESRARTAGGHARREDDKGGHGWVDAEHPDRERPPSLALGTPTYRCLEACTASGNIDPTDALLGATAKDTRTVEVRTLFEERL